MSCRKTRARATRGRERRRGSHVRLAEHFEPDLHRREVPKAGVDSDNFSTAADEEDAAHVQLELSVQKKVHQRAAPSGVRASGSGIAGCSRDGSREAGGFAVCLPFDDTDRVHAN